MQSITLYKNISSHHLAHLYEHIYYIHLATKLWKNNIYWGLDYDIVDATTTSGLVKISLEDYTNGLINLREVVELDIDFFMEITDIAIVQIESEYENIFDISNRDELIRALRKIHAAKWTIGPKKPKEKIQVKENIFTVGEEVGSTKLVITFAYPDSSRELLPLYRQTAWLTLYTAVKDIADTYAGFEPPESPFTDEKHQLMGTLRFAIYTKINVDKIIKDTVKELTTRGVYDRLVRKLSDIAAMDNPPLPENTFHDLGIRMTAKKWKEIATQENLEIVLKNLSYTSKIS